MYDGSRTSLTSQTGNRLVSARFAALNVVRLGGKKSIQNQDNSAHMSYLAGFFGQYPFNQVVKVEFFNRTFAQWCETLRKHTKAMRYTQMKASFLRGMRCTAAILPEHSPICLYPKLILPWNYIITQNMYTLTRMTFATCSG